MAIGFYSFHTSFSHVCVVRSNVVKNTILGLKQNKRKTTLSIASFGAFLFFFFVTWYHYYC